MLKRVKRIKGVGCFVDTRAGSAEFAARTVVYGDNCAGKSTLADILRSLVDTDPTIIESRRTLKGDGAPISQLVDLAFSDTDAAGEKTVQFASGAWNTGLLDTRLLVFDMNFIHRNVFTGARIERSNTENATRFILGQDSVELEKKIARAKSLRDTINRELSRLTRSELSTIQDVDAFIQLAVQDSEEVLEERFERTQKAIRDQEALASNLDEALSRDAFSKLPHLGDLDELLSQVNECMTAEVPPDNTSARDKLTEHIRAKTQGSESDRSWFRRGLSLSVAEYCPFCGRQSDTVSEQLLETYRSVFGSSYETVLSRLRERIRSTLLGLRDLGRLDIGAVVNANLELTAEYCEFEGDDAFTDAVDELSTRGSELADVEEGWYRVHSQEMLGLQRMLDKKADNPDSLSEAWSSQQVSDEFGHVQSAVASYNVCVDRLNALVHAWKQSLSARSIRADIARLGDEARTLQTARLRVQKERYCDRYKSLSHRLSQLRGIVERLERLLEASQQSLVERFFSSTAAAFGELGSGSIGIEGRPQRRGYMPVVQLHLSFENRPIPSDSINSFLSDSDRRALALALFLARLERLDQDERGKSVVVLDDPVTSFDDNRVDKTVRYLGRALAGFRQIIVFTHYRPFVARLLQTESTQEGWTVLELRRAASTSELRRGDPKVFAGDVHEQALAKIDTFIRRECDEDISRDLRIVLEKHIHLNYRRPIERLCPGQKQLGAVIETLHADGILDDERYKRYSSLNRSLRPDMHEWTSLRWEDRIALAKDLLDALGPS